MSSTTTTRTWAEYRWFIVDALALIFTSIGFFGFARILVDRYGTSPLRQMAFYGIVGLIGLLVISLRYFNAKRAD